MTESGKLDRVAPARGMAVLDDTSAAGRSVAKSLQRSFSQSQQSGPFRLPAPRGDRPDDLTRISGIGPSIERILFANGIFHLGQIAEWSGEDAAWVDALTGFEGRVMRERWIDQAMGLATNCRD